MRVDLHNHTPLCNHAVGRPEEYIERAIELGIDVYGFSDHAPMPFDPKYRMKEEEAIEYENSINFFKKKYASEIQVLLGYEVDFMQNRSLMLDEVLNAKVDYLIGSIHFLAEKNPDDLWGFDNPEFIGKYKEKNIDDIWSDYFEGIKQLADSNLFDIVGHVDLIKVFKYLPTKDIKSIALEAFKSIKKANMVMEINAAGLRKPIEQTYPSKELLELAYELDINITFSSDAHAIEQVGFGYDQAVELARSVGYSKAAYFVEREQQLVTF